MDAILIAAEDGRPLPTRAVDALPPWRARMTVHVAILAGAHLEHGNYRQLVKAATDAGGLAGPGWWRHALGLPPATEHPD